MPGRPLADQRKRPVPSRRHGEGHEVEIAHTGRSACNRPNRPTIRRTAPTAHSLNSRRADVTSESGVAATGAVPDSANPDVVLVGGGSMSAPRAAPAGVVAPRWTAPGSRPQGAVAGGGPDGGKTPGPGPP